MVKSMRLKTINIRKRTVNKHKTKINYRTKKNKNKNIKNGGALNLYDLITSLKLSNIDINYKDCIFKCILGNNMFIIGETINSSCIGIKYRFPIKKATLTSFFDTMNKDACFKKYIVVNKNLNNKQINEIIIEFIDILNINLGIESINLSDDSKLKDTEMCENIKLSVLKYIERGYGFYNEFGYLFKLIDNDDIYEDGYSSINYTDSLEESTEVFKSIETFRHKLINIDEIKILYGGIIPDNILIILNAILANNNNSITYTKFITELLNYCKKTATLSYLDKNSVLVIKEFMTQVIEKYFKINNPYINFQYKLYNYSDKDNITCSALINASSNDREFKMMKITKVEFKFITSTPPP